MVSEIEKLETQLKKTSAQSTKEKKPGSKLKKILIFGIIGLIPLSVGIHYYKHSMMYVSTEDAYVEGHIVQIAPKVSGNIIKVYVDDNQKVKEGQLIAEIEPKDYKVQYDQAVARLESAIAKHKGALVNVNLTSVTSNASSDQTQAALKEANHNVSAARAEINLAKSDFDRYTKMYSKGIVSQQDFEKVATNYKVTQERLSAALKSQDQAFERAKGTNTSEQQIAISNAQLKGASADIKQLKSAVEQAKLNLSYTKIYAPQTGSITRKSIEKGSYVQTGQPLLAIVPEKRWIVANFKETQLENMRVGQPVFIKIDAYPNKKFLGQVDSIQNASGAKTSLFPPENAVGSFVKVVQRIPVKITFKENWDSKYAIVPGMSVVPEVKVK